ncbi:pathogenesis associated protein [Niveomyces insectorum RCEF 264]|uniref:Pathogenesis associated protein n=1 Tax=Niveomyces insectorum RCEF 264 TaxID=1081102 RepID=A0A167QCZ2_9HYPO|nr:pathogenesis associated protein [Niveomyces insectorum RCEF 264]
MASPQVNGVSDVNGVNGVRPSSAFIDHLLQYPVVADSVASVQHTKYGQQTLALGASAYATLARTIEPLLATPYGYVAPYVVPVVSSPARRWPGSGRT